jgi:hypothetical protein
MKTYLLSFILLLSQLAKAQITVNQSDFVTAGDIIYMASDSNCITSPGIAGANMTWNLSSLNNHTVDTSWFLNPAGNPGANLFTGANLVQKMPDGAGGFFYAYYQVTSTFVDMLGFTDGTNHTPYDVPYRQFTFPATYNSTFSGTSVMHFTFPYPLPPYDSAKIVVTNTYTSLVDGWGTVTTPTGTYGSLRQRMVTSQSDSTFLHDSTNNTWTWDGTPPTPNPADTGYNWVAKTTKFNVAGISINDPGNVPAATGTYLLAVVSSLNEKASAKNLVIYPNPMTTESIIESDRPFQNANLKVYNMVGELVKEIAQINGNQVRLQKEHLPNGVYYIQISELNEVVATRKFLIAE